MRGRSMAPEEMMKIEIRLLKEMAARYGGLLAREDEKLEQERKKRRAAARRARAVCARPTELDKGV